MKNMKRTFLVGLIWGLIFFLWWLKGFLHQNWNFDLFSLASWKYLYNEFVGGWVISATSDWIFLWTLILAIPLFVLGWNIFLKVKWRQTFLTPLKKLLYFLRGKKAAVTKKKYKYAKKKSHKKVRPVPLYTSAKALERNAKSDSKRKTAAAGAVAGAGAMAMTTPSYSAPQQSMPMSMPSNETVPSFLDDEDLANMSLDDIELPTRTAVTENIPDILIKAGYKVIADIELSGIPVEFAAIDGAKVLLLVADNETGDWLADEEKFNGEEPLWFSESSHRVSPVYKVLEMAKTFTEKLKKLNDKHEVVPVLMKKDGTILNAEDMKSTWKEMGIIVCRTNLGGPDELLTVEQAVPAFDGEATAADVELIQNAF